MKQTDFQLETMVARKWWKIFKELSLKSGTVNPEFHVLVWNLRSFLGVIWNWLPYTEDKERSKKEADQSRLAGDRFKKQGNLHKRFFVLGNPTKKQISAPASQNVKCLYRALMGSVTHSVQTISTPYSLKAASLKKLQMGRIDMMHVPRTVRDKGLQLPGSSLRVNQWSHPLNNLLQYC